MALTIDNLQIEIMANSTAAMSGIDALSASLERLRNASGGGTVSNLKRIASSMTSVASASSGVIAANNRMAASYMTLGARLTRVAVRGRILYGVFYRLARVFANWYNESNQYIEALNLFTVSMGDAADAALEYANTVGEIMGIDPAEWITNQGVFMRMATGFGVATEQAEIMSQGLTQLGYDMASFFNTDVETAMQKIQSGMTGQIKGLKTYGYDLSVAALQETAYAHGIAQRVSTMSQAQKAQLRYITLIDHSNGIMGDMARTLVTPANALRILNSQLTLMKRALGNVISVIATKFIPYVQAFVQIVAEAANELADLWGFELPTIDYSDVDLELGSDISEELDEATNSAKELKRQLLGIDELNVLNDSSGSDSAIGTSYDLGIDLPTYDFLGGLSKKTDELKTKMEGVLKVIGAIGTAFITWKLSKSFVNTLSTVTTNLTKLKTALGLTLMVTGLSLEYTGGYDIGYNGATLENVLKTAIGGALGVAGSLLVFGTGPLGWTIGIAAALTVAIASISIGAFDKAKEEDLAGRFGDLELSGADITAIVNDLTTSNTSLGLELYVDEETTLESAKTSVESAIRTLNSLNYKVGLGVEVTQSEYQSAVDSFVDSAQTYLDQKKLVAGLAIEVLFGNNGSESDIGSALYSDTADFYSSAYATLYEKGVQLKNIVAEGFVEGEWIPDKLEQAQQLQGEIQEVLDKVSAAETKAQMTALKMDFANVDLTVESFTGLMEDAQAVLDDQVASLESTRLSALVSAELQFEANIEAGMIVEDATAILNETVAAIQTEYAKGMDELTFSTADFGLGTLVDAYSTEVELARSAISEQSASLISGIFANVDPQAVYDGAYHLVYGLIDVQQSAFEDAGVTKAMASNVADLMETLKPTAEQQATLAEEYRKAGMAVPSNISAGLTDAALLSAMAGDTDAMFYLVGQHLSTEPAFLDTLATAWGAGAQLNESAAAGLLNNLHVVENAAEGTVTLMNDTIGSKTLEITPELVANMKALGINLSDGLLAGAQSEMQATKKKWHEWAIWPWNWFKEKNEIHSPSKLFERGGVNIIEGLWKGLQDTWNQLKSWWSHLSLPSFNIKMPHISWTTTQSSGWISETLAALGLPTSIPKMNISWYASGGFPTTGEMFIAREAGPEMVGRIGSKTTVANNDQIVDGIATGVQYANEGVISAIYAMARQVVTAIEENGGDVNMDGNKVGEMTTNAQNRRTRMYGKNLQYT